MIKIYIFQLKVEHDYYYLVCSDQGVLIPLGNEFTHEYLDKFYGGAMTTSLAYAKSEFDSTISFETLIATLNDADFG